MPVTASRALIVEDSPAWQEILAEILADQGLIIDITDNVQDAIASLRGAAHRLAVIDLSLEGSVPSSFGQRPGQNEEGLRVLEAVKRLDPGCVSLLLTGYATVEVAVSALTELGAYTCLRKESFRRAEFRELVHRVLALAPATLPSSPLDEKPDGIPYKAVERPGSSLAILLVEDDAGWRSILAELLSEAGYLVRACPSYSEAAGYLRREACALAVVDLGLASSRDPDANRDGYQVLASARSAGVPAIVVSGLATPADVERVYSEYSVFACLEKQAFDRAAFSATVTGAIAAGQAGSGEIGKLTPREREVTELLVQGLANKEIAQALVISTNTVKRYLKSIFEKLDVDSRAAAVARAMAAGMKTQLSSKARSKRIQ
jgi:DNA-binding NarL/FixJ family response regulator